MIDNLTPLVHKRIEKQIDKASLKKIRPSSAGNQVNVKEMIKQLKSSKGGTGEKQQTSQPTNIVIKNELKVNLEEKLENKDQEKKNESSGSSIFERDEDASLNFGLNTKLILQDQIEKLNQDRKVYEQEIEKQAKIKRDEAQRELISNRISPMSHERKFRQIEKWEVKIKQEIKEKHTKLCKMYQNIYITQQDFDSCKQKIKSNNPFKNDHNFSNLDMSSVSNIHEELDKQLSIDTNRVEATSSLLQLSEVQTPKEISIKSDKHSYAAVPFEYRPGQKPKINSENNLIRQLGDDENLSHLKSPTPELVNSKQKGGQTNQNHKTMTKVQKHQSDSSIIKSDKSGIREEIEIDQSIEFKRPKIKDIEISQEI